MSVEAGIAKRATRRTPPAGKEKEHSIPRERIVHAAARLFHEQGYATTTVRDIAHEVGILSGSLFHHFGSKLEMLLEIMHDAATSVCVAAEQVVERRLEPVAALRELIRLEFVAITHPQRRHFHGVLFFEWREVPEDQKMVFTALRKRYQGAWLDVLEQCRYAGRLRCEPHAASLILHGALRNALTWYSPSGRYGAEEFGDLLAHLVIE